MKRLDLRGHKIRSLTSSGLNLSQNLEFVYLRDNLLSTLDGIEVLKRVKVLDLSFNDFKGPGFEPLENCKALQFLSVAQNKLKSLSMASQPRLQVLAASKNKISTLKGFPCLPALEHLRVEENPILKMSHLEAASILLVGPTLKKFNDRDLSREEIAIAKRYPSHTALCIRGGWELCRPEQAVDSTFKFLLEQWKEQLPSGYLLKHASVDHPFEEDACCCHFEFVRDVTEDSGSALDLKYQWFIGDRTPSNFTAISGACKEIYFPKNDDIGRILKVECTPILGDTEYPTIFAISSPVSPVHASQIHDMQSMKGITAELGREGWHWNPKVMKIDVRGELVEGNTIKVTEEGAKGEPQYAITDYVKAAPPSVTDVQVTGDVVEGNTIRGIGKYFGGKEGPSTFEWLREDKDTGEFTLVLTGQEGKSMSVVSQTVKQGGSKVTVTGIVTGGMEASSRVQWFKTSSSTFEGENGREPLSTSKIAKGFRIPLGAVGKYIVAKFTPMTPDGEAGEPAYVISDTVVETLPPSLNFLSITGDYSEGGVLTASYGYIGGHEGKSIYNWYLHEVENDPVLIPEVSGLLQYRVPKDAIGKFISFTCTPVRNDGIAGEPRTCIGQERVRPGNPRLLSLQINGTAIEGTTLNVEKKYWGGEEESQFTAGSGLVQMFPVSPSEMTGPVVLLSSLNKLDQLCLVEGDCLYEWFRVKGNGLREKLHVGEFLDLTFNEVGECVELVYTPVRADGMKGSPKTLVLILLLLEVVPEKRYFGGQEGAGKYIWFRTKNKPHEPALMELANNCENVDIRGQTICGDLFSIVLGADTVRWEMWKAFGVICESPVIPAVPAVSNVCVKKLSSSTYYGEGEYFGGYEGASLFSWYRQSDDGTVLLIEGANCKTYEVTDEDYNYRLLFGYTPVRSDSVVGELRLSEPSDVILPELPRIEMLALTGKAVEGEVLTALEVIPKSENQQLVWGQYKKEVKYQWFFSSETENEKSFELFPSQRSCSYKVRFEDIGHYLRCECIVTDVFGRSSEPAYAETSSVLPGVPRMDKLEIEGRGFHTNLYAVRGVYSGGKEGKSRIQWLRSMVGSPDLISIPGETGRMYEANVDDVGYRFIVINVFHLLAEPDVHKEVKQKLDLGSVKFEALCDKDRSAKRVPGMGSLERRILEVNRKRVKVVKPGSKTSFPTTEIRGSYAPPFHVELFRNDQHRLRIVVDSENEVDLMVQTRHLRDVIVLVIQGLAQRFNSTSLNTLLKIEA
ncbi:UNVERIFIED_CONTAM: microtubule-associated protein AIR9 [Sesamum radiatum]|uniref:Microtubule-associated protein AIR9 n=1 Tax=Sesamum radiatum TaxID=300843 RepID=A0AAW2KFZ9_SESRA